MEASAGGRGGKKAIAQRYYEIMRVVRPSDLFQQRTSYCISMMCDEASATPEGRKGKFNKMVVGRERRTSSYALSFVVVADTVSFACPK
eukprot:605583-Rhodomonas_salina.2